MKSALKISVIIPIFNTEDHLEQCLDSIFSQSVEDIEIICVDDCSTDRSYQILQEYKKKDNRVKVLRNDRNISAGPSRNRGIAAATGEYIHFLDADDYIASGAYETMYDKIKNNRADILRTKAVGIASDSGEITYPPYYSFDMLDISEINNTTNLYTNPELFFKTSVVVWAGLFKRTFLTENNIRFPALYCVNDRAFYAAAIIAAKKVCFLDEYVIYHRLPRPTSLVGQRHKHFECHFQSYEIITSQCENLSPEIKRMILDGELRDIFTWYFVCSKDRNYGRDIYIQTKQFLEHTDMSLFNKTSFSEIESFSYNWELIKNKKWIFFGAGIIGKASLEDLWKLDGNIEFFLDNDINKHGTEFCGLPVYSPDYLVKINIDEYFIIISSAYNREISQQLEQMGYVEGKHYSIWINWGAIVQE